MDSSAYHESYDAGDAGTGSAMLDTVDDSEAAASDQLRDKTEREQPCCCGSCFIAARPVLSACSCCGLLVLIVIIGLVTLPLQLETNFDSFLISDVQSSLLLSSFNSATASRSTGVVRRLQASFGRAYHTKDLYLAYSLASPAGSNGILSTKFLSQIARIEQSLRETSGFVELCNKTDVQFRGLCNPGLSLSSYALPTLNVSQGSIVPNSMTLDGLGFDPVPIRTAFLVASKHGLEDVFLPTGYDPEVDERAEVLRSVFRFRFDVGTVQDPVADRVAAANAVDDMWEDFFTNIVVATFRESDLLKGVDLNVWFDGTGFRDFEVLAAVLNDIPLAVGSAAFILAYMLFHTRSIILAVVGPFLAMMAVPITFTICGVFFGTTTVNFANFLAVFLAIGFGADVMFVYYDSWSQSVEVAESIPNRLAWTYRRAVKASLATTSTTALSFLCNMASVIRALRQFGFFMGLCVLVAWVHITFIYVPFIVIDHKLCSRIRLVHRPSERRLKSSTRKYSLWAHGLYRCRIPIVFLTVAGVVACVIVAAMGIETNTSFPDIFPSNHNQNEGVRILQDFDSMTTALPIDTQEPIREVNVCQETDFSNTPCVMHWCEASFVDYKPRWWGNGTCNCLRRLRASCPANTPADVNLRLVGTSSLTPDQLINVVGDYVQAGAVDIGWDLSDAERQRLESTQAVPQLLQQVWETGDTSLEDMLQTSTRLTGNGQNFCGWDEICFCAGELQCKLASAWRPSGNLVFPIQRRLEEEETCSPSGRFLQTDTTVTVPRAKRIKVRTVFGIIPDTNTKLLGERTPEEVWSFSASFDLSDPWAQRAMYFFCKDVPEELKITRRWCWFEDFRLFSRQFQGRFPVKAIDWPVLSKLFVDTSASATRGTRYLWLENDVIKGMYYSFEAGVHREAEVQEILDYKAAWSSYINSWNGKSSPKAAPGFQVSSDWVHVESASTLISSTATSLIVLCALALVCMLLFTRSCILSLIVVFSTIIVIIVLAFFITTVMEWQVGLIEVIAFIYFIGYAVDYSLHIVYKYGSHEALDDDDQEWLGANSENASQRLQRTRFALKTMGSATTGSAITTAGSSFFLVFCTLTVFAKLGAMCFAVTTASIVFALCPLGSFLMMFGPVRPGNCGLLRLRRTQTKPGSGLSPHRRE